MRINAVLLAAAVATTLIAPSAFAGSANSSPAFVQQAIGYGAGNGFLDTATIFKPSLDVISSAARAAGGPDSLANLSMIYQSGDLNTATINQSGARNVGLIQQIGYMNSASISQSGIGHQGFISQQGSNNIAIIRQR